MLAAGVWASTMFARGHRFRHDRAAAGHDDRRRQSAAVGFFRLVNGWVVALAHRPLQLLSAVTLAAGVFSAFLLNDAICLVMTPLVIELVRRLRREPAPYLLAVAMASNIGSAATITGNPQNILIGSFSHIPYAGFAARLAPVAASGLVVTVALIALMSPQRVPQRRDDAGAPIAGPPASPARREILVVVLLMMAGFFAGQPPAKVALVAGGFLLLTRVVSATAFIARSTGRSC